MLGSDHSHGTVGEAVHRDELALALDWAAVPLLPVIAADEDTLGRRRVPLVAIQIECQNARRLRQRDRMFGDRGLANYRRVSSCVRGGLLAGMGGRRLRRSWLLFGLRLRTHDHAGRRPLA